MSHAQMIAKAWLDDGYRAALLAQGIEVPPRPDDLADEELDTCANGKGSSEGEPAFMSFSCAGTCACLVG
jgi:hypothetical protein